MSDVVPSAVMVTASSGSAARSRLGWRGPFRCHQLKSIVESVPGCGSGTPCIDPVFVAGRTQPAFYWSSTTFVGQTLCGANAWAVTFGYGSGDNLCRSTPLYVRAVRGGS